MSALCRICGCVEEDCSWCITLSGRPCFWVDPDLCSACFFEPGLADSVRARLRAKLALHHASRRKGFPLVSVPLRQHGWAMLRVCKRIERAEKKNAP